MFHAMNRLEVRRLALEMLAHLRLYPGHVVRVNEVVPVEKHFFLVRIVPEHCFPAPGETDALGLTVEVPYAVISRCGDEFVALLQLVEHALVVNPFEPGRERGADQLQQQVQARIPAAYGIFVGKREKTGDLVVHRKTDNKDRSDMQLGQPLKFYRGHLGAIERVGNLDDLQMTKAFAQPRPALDRFTAENLGIALGETPARSQHGLEV